MLKSFTFGTAGIAIAASLMGTAHAQDQHDALVAETEEAEIVLVTDEQDEDDDSADGDASSNIYAVGPLSDDADAYALAAAYPTQLIAIDAQFSRAGAVEVTASQPATAVTAQVAGPLVSTGIVTPQGVDPFYRDISPFYGNIDPFYGDIDAFWGNINPFYGDINPFWGDINPFYRDISPFYGDIDAFWGNINPFYGDINPFWGNIDPFSQEHLSGLGEFWKKSGEQISKTEANWSSLKYTINASGSVSLTYDGTPNKIRNALETLIAQGEAHFGAAYTAKTGKSFRDGFVDEILARHGLDLTNTSAAKKTLAKSDAERAAFYLDWYDSLNLYSGVDAVDHWMAAVNWTPAVTQIQSWGYESLIGVIDSDFGDDPDLSDNLVFTSGTANKIGGHGAGVASLIFGAHDGEGVMGIAPNAKVRAYNPFGNDGTATWDDIGDGIVELKTNRTSFSDMVFRQESATNASVINLSLGEKGWVFSPGLAKTLYRSDVDNHYHDTVFVFAAGNDGITQTKNIEFNDADEVAMIFVGSINPLGEISQFSNRPGNACLTDHGVCKSGNRLMDRFIVAPGELLLVSDGMGGVVRRSGTSFAAPLVSGAVALLHSRWPWLTQYPHETSEIIFRSARDLGAPGVDEVYGHGLLDVTASQSPLDFNDLSFKMYERSGWFWKSRNISATELLGAGVPSWWETDDVFFSMFEEIGDTKRDFVVPMSAYTYGKSTNALGRGYERLQDFVATRFANWINSGGTDRDGDGQAGFSEVRSTGSDLNGAWALRYDAIMPTITPEGTWRPTHGAATLTNPNGTMSFTVGHGQGAMALGGYRFGIMSDHDPFTGGVNPVLGFASGETFAAAEYKIAKGTSVKVGYSENREEFQELNFVGANPDEMLARQAMGDRPASAMTLDIEQKVSDRVSVGVNYTRLRETNALLGTQTSATALLGNGSRTEAMTVSASFDVGSGISFDLSATGGRTETADGQLFATAGDVWSTAGQFTATKRGVFSGADSLRVSVAQPLQIEQGALEFTGEEIIDRETGETGLVTQTFGIETQRRITGEAVYALPLTKSSEFGVFGRYVSAGEVDDNESYVVGGNYTLRF